MSTKSFKYRKWLIHKEQGLWKIHLLSEKDKTAYGAHDLAFPSCESAVSHLAERCMADIEKAIAAIRGKQDVPQCQYRIDAETCKEEVERLLHNFELFECLMNGECVRHDTGNQ